MKNDELEHLAKLSFINLTDEENIEFEKQLNELIAHIEDTLGKINWENNIAQKIGLNKVELFHDDYVIESNVKDEIFTNIRREKNGFVIVPKIIKEGN